MKTYQSILPLSSGGVLHTQRLLDRAIYGDKRDAETVGAIESLHHMANAYASDQAKIAAMRQAIALALNELGVPQPGYPTPVTNAVELLRAALQQAKQGGES